MLKGQECKETEIKNRIQGVQDSRIRVKDGKIKKRGNGERAKRRKGEDTR
jgi:hypothetical protein